MAGGDEEEGGAGGVKLDPGEEFARGLDRGVKDTTRGTEADTAYKKLKTGR